MKVSRSWNRRDFDVTANGYFTILKPSGWFATVRLPSGFRYRFGQPKAIASPQADGRPADCSTISLPPGSASVPLLKILDHPASEQALSRLQILPPSTDHRSLMRPVLIALAATLITFLLLCWTAFPLIRGYVASITHSRG